MKNCNNSSSLIQDKFTFLACETGFSKSDFKALGWKNYKFYFFFVLLLLLNFSKGLRFREATDWTRVIVHWRSPGESLFRDGSKRRTMKLCQSAGPRRPLQSQVVHRSPLAKIVRSRSYDKLILGRRKVSVISKKCFIILSCISV